MRRILAAVLALAPQLAFAAGSGFGWIVVRMNEHQLAHAHLDAGLAADGQGTWTEAALASAIKTGVTHTY